MKIEVAEHEIEFTAVRSQGAGGQNVNKVSSAVHLRFDIRRSSLPDAVKARLLELADQRITRDGVLVIKAQTERSQERNRAEAIARLEALVESVAVPPKLRRATRPPRAVALRRLDSKTQRGALKAMRSKVGD